jgi:hypothetical protein
MEIDAITCVLVISYGNFERLDFRDYISKALLEPAFAFPAKGYFRSLPTR